MTTRPIPSAGRRPPPPARRRAALRGAVLALGLIAGGCAMRRTTVISFHVHPDSAQAAAIRRAAAGDFADVRRTEGHTLEYWLGLADLNGDGRPDLIVQYHDIGFCGTAGCGLVVVLATPQGWARATLPVQAYLQPGDDLVALPSRHHGMRDLRYPTGYVSTWDGSKYR